MSRISCNLFAFILLGSVVQGELFAQDSSSEWSFRIRTNPAIQKESFTGRVYVFFHPSNSRSHKEPRFGPDWFQPQPFIAKDVVDLKPGEEVTLTLDDPELLKFPKDLTDEKLRWMNAQAVIRYNPWEREVGNGPGNGYSQVFRLGSPQAVSFNINRLVPEQKFPETPWTKLLRVRSDLLSEFHGRDVYIQGSVTLPASYYSQPQRRYPVILEVPGFSGSHMHGIHNRPVREMNSLGVEFIRVMLDPNCPLGHHVFANSANNGPVMDALIQEWIPALDAAFRTDARPEARFLTGHSSGGWSSLWLQVMAPDVFGGTWSTAPDSVCFEDFQLINVYRDGEKMFVDQNGERRPIVRVGGKPVVYYDTFSQMEDVLGHGGQLMSFEAVFSPRGEDGLPLQLWDRETGEIDPEVAAAWEKYDILHYLEKNWATLAPQLQGKIHVYMGTEDTFYLDGATRLLQTRLQELGSDAHVELIPGRDHMNLFDGDLDYRIAQSMARKYRQVPAEILQNEPESAKVQ